MEQLLIIEDDIGLNQGLSKALKADDRQIISCQDLKTAKEQLLCGGVSLILLDRKSTRLNSSHVKRSRMPSSA